MKKIKFVLLGLLSLTLFAGCQMENDNGNTGGESPAKVDNAQAVDLYKNLIGTKWEIDKDTRHGRFDYPTEISFQEDSVTFDKKQYSVNKNELQNYKSDIFFMIIGNGTFRVWNSSYGLNLRKNADSDPSYVGYTLVSSTDNGNSSGGTSEATSTVKGTYSFNNASGMQYNGSITLKGDGTWSYTSTRNGAPLTDRTYTANGKEVTLNWSAGGISFNETFSVSVSETSSTWKSKNEYTSVLFQALFNMAGKTELTFEYSK
ncbi:hypothetical protein [Treponema pectinovorum]|uniref:hypothetical protein n=1 Tax=Treponema pectinovorum TaxID=164 RepID=UPI0011F398E5|nr:hypothetical protein [Treponema pectinovorum]